MALPRDTVGWSAVFTVGGLQLLAFCLLLLLLCNCSMFCCMLLYVHSSIAIIFMGKRELVALLNLSSWCLVMVERLFLAVPWGCLRFVIVVFPDHTHLLFLIVVFPGHICFAFAFTLGQLLAVFCSLLKQCKNYLPLISYTGQTSV